MEVYHFNTEITEGRYKGKTIEEVFSKHPDFIFKTIKKWAINGVNNKTFDDEVLAAAHISKHEGEHHIYQEEFSVPRDKEATKPMKKLRKENKSIDEIFDEMDEERYNYKKFDNNSEKEEDSENNEETETK